MALRSAGLNTHIWNNNILSMILLLLYPALLIGIVWVVAVVIGAAGTGIPLFNGDAGISAVRFADNIVVSYWPIIAQLCALWFATSWFFNLSLIRRLSKSHAVTRADEPALYNMLENLSITAGIPMPRLEIIETHARNAFASGVDTKSFCVTVTRGLMNSLEPDELEAVLAHELGHILNRDVRLLMVCIIFTGIFSFAAQMMWSNIRYNLRFGRKRGRGSRGGGFILIFALSVILWIGYMASLIMRFALSRRREYMADATAVQLTKSPESMMRALMRIAGRDVIPGLPSDVQMMCIENSMPFLGLFSTHPSLKSRIKAIAEMTDSEIPTLESLAPANAETSFAKGGDKANRNPWLIRTRR